jgi:hypothetical protein
MIAPVAVLPPRAGIVTIRFSTKWPWNPASPIIARLGGSRQWSHCMAIIEGTAYEATMFHGCRVVPLAEAMVGVAAYRDMDVWVADLDAAIKFGQDQDGKGYDYAGALGIPFMASENWGDDTSWWCSEHCFMLVGAGGTWLLDKAEQHRVTPDDLHQCNYPKGDLVRVPKPMPVLRHFVDQRGQVMFRVVVLAAVVGSCAGLTVRHLRAQLPPEPQALCKDLTVSYSRVRPGTCARHGGVREWLQ